jgi:hypothetical protein
MKSRPDFFIIGAPKCGTTALSEYLRRHPRIGFSQPKEPVYFCTDFPKVRNYTEETDYLEHCFGHCRPSDCLAIGEGSTAYFYSTEAAGNILRFDPGARFIIMLRNPVDMIPALHAQKLLSLEEDESSFETAWALRRERLAGRKIPKFCVEPRLVDYADLGRLGQHAQRLFQEIPEPQRLVILFDDFARDTRSIYRQVLAFLGVPDDGRTEFPRINESRRLKNPTLYEFGHRPPPMLMRIVNAIKTALGIERLGILSRLLDWNVRQSERKPLSATMKQTLRQEFSEDIDRLATLLGRDLSDWRREA